MAASDEFQHATDLVKYIKAKHGDHFCIGVAGQSLVHTLQLEVHVVPVRSADALRSLGARLP